MKSGLIFNKFCYVLNSLQIVHYPHIACLTIPLSPTGRLFYHTNTPICSCLRDFALILWLHALPSELCMQDFSGQSVLSANITLSGQSPLIPQSEAEHKACFPIILNHTILYFFLQSTSYYLKITHLFIIRLPLFTGL